MHLRIYLVGLIPSPTADGEMTPFVYQQGEGERDPYPDHEGERLSAYGRRRGVQLAAHFLHGGLNQCVQGLP